MSDPIYNQVTNVGRAEPVFIFIKDSSSQGGDDTFRVLSSADLAGDGAASVLIDSASDLVVTYTYLSPSDATDRRVSTCVKSSALVGSGYTDTFTYTGSAGDYYLTSVTRS